MGNNRVGRIRNIRTIKALRGDPLSIDLGRTISGNLRAWMKKKPDSEFYREFDILQNRYLTLSREKTSDLTLTDGTIDKICGRWYFDVELIKPNELGSSRKTIYTGTILFIGDITGSSGDEISALEIDINMDGGNSRSIYLQEQIIDLGSSSTINN